jgi:hypothetical protein
MANLFIAYDLDEPDKNYAGVEKAIKSISGVWAHVELSLWYVSAPVDAQTAFNIVWAEMQAQDKLIVIDTSRNSAFWGGLNTAVSDYLKNQWWK